MILIELLAAAGGKSGERARYQILAGEGESDTEPADSKGKRVVANERKSSSRTRTVDVRTVRG